MPEYRTIARPVEAIPWIDTPDGTDAVFAWIERFGGRAAIEPGGHLARFVNAAGRIVAGRLVVLNDLDAIDVAVAYPDDWLVREAGRFHAMPEAAFRLRYEEVPV